MHLSRRQFLGYSSLMAASTVAGLPGAAKTSEKKSLAESVIPSSGQKLARIGLGTWQTFDMPAGDAELRGQLAEVLRIFGEAGADVIDTSPMYGRSEAVLGDLLAGGI